MEEQVSWNRKIRSMQNSFIGTGISTVLTMTIGAPVERIKLILQNQDASTQIRADQRYKGITDCCKRIIGEQGFFSLWRGYFIMIIRYFPSKALTFTLFNHFKDKADKTFTGHLIVGAGAGCISTFVFYPLGFVRTRLGVDVGRNSEERQFKNFFDCTSKIIQSDGIKGLYRGLILSLFLTTISKSFYFGLFESGKIHLDFIENTSHHYVSMWAFATLTTALGYFFCYPLDTIRRRLMMQSGRKDVLYSGTVDCLTKILAKEGPTGFYKGFSAQIIKSLGTSIFLVVNEILQNMHKHKND